MVPKETWWEGLDWVDVIQDRTSVKWNGTVVVLTAPRFV